MSSVALATPERRRLLAWLVLLLGLAFASMPLLSQVPREQTLVFRIQNRDVTRLDASFTKTGETTPFAGVTLRFPDRAPRSVRHQVSLPNGEYMIAVEVESASGQAPRGSAALDDRVDPRAEQPPPAASAARLDGQPSSGSASARETSWVRRVSLQGGETVIPL